MTPHERGLTASEAAFVAVEEGAPCRCTSSRSPIRDGPRCSPGSSSGFSTDWRSVDTRSYWAALLGFSAAGICSPCPAATHRVGHQVPAKPRRAALLVASRQVSARASHWSACRKHSKADFTAPSVTLGVGGARHIRAVPPVSQASTLDTDGGRCATEAEGYEWLRPAPQQLPWGLPTVPRGSWPRGSGSKRWRLPV